MKRTVRASVLVLVASVAAAFPADATKYTYVVTGTTTDDVEDVYGYEGATLPIGSAFTLTYVLDDAVPTASYTYGATGSSATGGGAHNNGALPPLAATLTVGNYSYTVRQGDLYRPYAIDSVGDPVGTQIDEQDSGTAAKSLTAHDLTLDVSYSNNQVCCGIFFGYSQSSTDRLFVDLTSSEFTSADFRETGTFALDPASTGFFLTAYQSFFHDGTVGVSYDSAGLSATRLTVTSDAVPEPASWALLVGGFGLAGLNLRRARPSRLRRAGR